VVQKVNPHEWLYTLCDTRYQDTLTLHEEVDGVYQEEELSTSFTDESSIGLDDLVGDADGIQTP
jgi:hypothetical protein